MVLGCRGDGGPGDGGGPGTIKGVGGPRGGWVGGPYRNGWIGGGGVQEVGGY